MSERSVDIWTCDRCGEVTEKRRNEQPSYWRRIRFYNPPMCADEERGRAMDLCRECVGALSDWLSNPPPVVPAPSVESSPGEENEG